jgi:hypothetical protein
MKNSRRRSKKHFRRSKKYRGGGKPEQSEFIRYLQENISRIKSLGLTKIVATPQSEVIRVPGGKGVVNTRFATLWNDLSAEDRAEVREKVYKAAGYTLGVYISQLDRPANTTIIYAIEYLAVLASLTGRTIHDILIILETATPKTQEEMDIIMVAFGDKYKEEGHQDLSPTGEILEQQYLDFWKNPRALEIVYSHLFIRAPPQ